MNDIREDLKAFVDGELSEARAAEVAAAISADPELAQEAEFMKMLGFEIKRMAPEPSIEGRAAAILKVKNAKNGIRWNPMQWSFGWQAAAGVVFVAVVASIVFPGLARPTQVSSEVAMIKEDPGLKSLSSTEAQDSHAAPRPDSKAGVDVDSYGAAGENGRGAGAPSAGGGGGGFGFRDEEAMKGPNDPTLESRQTPGSSNINPTASKPEWGPNAKTSVPEESKTTVPMRSGADKRLVIKNADMSVRVDSARKAMESAGTIADSLGGFVINSSSNDLEGTEPSGTVVLRVPATRFDLAMQKLRALGKVTNESSTGEDVTAQVADIGARIKVLRAEEDSYITMLRAARRVNEMLEIKERLSGVRQEIESLTAQITALKDMATLSTITATFHQKVSINEPEEDPKGGFDETWAGAVNGLKAVGTFLANVVIVIFVYSPIWLPVVGIAWWLTKRNRKVS